MITPKDLASAFERDLSLVKEQTRELTHADALRQLPFQGNCMNWTLGHIANTRDLVLQRLGGSALLTEAQNKRYGYGSMPVCEDGGDIMTLEALLDALERSQVLIAEALSRATPEQLSQSVDTFLGKSTLGNFLFVLYGHERHHIGALDLLRELALSEE